MSTRKRVVPLVAVVIFLGALTYSLLPYKVLGIDCGPALLGSTPKNHASAPFLVTKEASVCKDRGGSRLATAGLIGVVAVILGLSGLLSPPARPYGLTVDSRRPPPGDGRPDPEPGPPEDPPAPPTSTAVP